MNETEVSVLTPGGIFFQGNMKSIYIKGSEGYMGIYYDHTPLVTTIEPGRLSLNPAEGKSRQALVSKGLLQVKPDKVTVLVNSAEWV